MRKLVSAQIERWKEDPRAPGGQEVAGLDPVVPTAITTGWYPCARRRTSASGPETRLSLITWHRMIEWVSAQPASPSYRFVAAWRVQAGWLVCQRPQPGDEQDLYEAVMVSMDHLRPWMPWARGYTPRMATEFVERHSGPADQTPVDDAPYVIRDRRGLLLGVCGLHARLGAHRLEIGYWVDVRHTRRGVATLACAALTELALTIPELTVVEIHHDQANLASAAIPAKLGYQHVATCRDTPEAPGEIGIEWQWRMSRADWPNSPGAQLLAAARMTTL